MKKIILLLIISHSILATSQKKHTKDFTIGIVVLYGTNTFIEMPESNAKNIWGNNIPTPKTYEDVDVFSTPIINGTFKYAIRNNWFLNADISFQYLKTNSHNMTNTRKRTYLTLGTGSEYHYLNRRIFQLYSGINIAYTTVRESHKRNIKPKTFNYPDFHLNALGIRIGKKIAGTFELGFGYKGIVNFGLSYQLE